MSTIDGTADVHVADPAPERKGGVEGSTIVLGVGAALLGLSALGNLLLWFQADWVADVDQYFALFCACLLLFANNTSFVPERLKLAVRTVGIFLFYSFIDGNGGVVCAAHKAFDTQQPAGITGQQYHTWRAGVVLALMGNFSSFFLSLIAPGGKSPSEAFGKKGFLSLRAIFYLGAAACLFLTTFMVWGIKKGCTAPPPNAKILNVSPMLLAFFIIFGLATDDKELQDIAMYFGAVWNWGTFRTVFVDVPHPNQDLYPHVWRAEMAFGFLATFLMLVGNLVYAFRSCRTANDRHAPIVGRAATKTFSVLVLLFLVGFSGAICVYVRSPQHGTPATYSDKSGNWGATFLGMLIPIFAIVGWLSRTKGISLLAALLSLVFAFESAQYVSSARGYKLGGWILVMATGLFSPLLALAEKAALSGRAEAYLEGETRTATYLTFALSFVAMLCYNQSKWNAAGNVYLFVFACGLYLWLGLQTKDKSLIKLTHYHLLQLLAQRSLWPLSPSFGGNTVFLVLLLVVGWAVIGFIVAQQPDAVFEHLHACEEYEDVDKAEALVHAAGPGGDGDAAVPVEEGGYKAVADAEGERL